MKAMNPCIACLFIILILLISGCEKGPVEELSRQEIFSLGIGKMDNQIDLFQIKGELFNHKNRIYMRDGLFYIANGNSAKIMEFSSYGDLIFLLYNPERNPHPVSFSAVGTEGVATTRKAIRYPLGRIGEIAVDSDKSIYIEDFVPEERQIKDKELGVILNRVILRFDRHGKLLDFIGQEGIGGTPFPFINSIHISDENELVVICRTTQKWLVFWFSSGGVLLYQVEIDEKHLPAMEGQKEMIPFVAKMVPDLKKHYLYLALYYYMDSIDESARLTTTVKNFSSRIYSLNLETGRYGNYIEIPQNGFRKEKIGTREIDIPAPSYELIGLSSGGAFFLLRREAANLFQLLILNNAGKILARRYLVMEDSELYFKEVNLSATGIIYALLGEEYSAKIVWWRSDKLLKEEKNE